MKRILLALGFFSVAVWAAGSPSFAQEDEPADVEGTNEVTEPEDESAPEESWGDPIEMDLPESVEEAMRDQSTAITRMRVYFDEGNSEDGISLEFDDMHTEVPIIYAAFIGEECDRALTYEEWESRRGRYVDLGFEVKTAPARLENLEVRVVHSHLKGEEETDLSTFEVTVPDDGESWDSLRLRGSLPGINRYTLEVSYTNGMGERTTHKGFSHWVIVMAPPMFQFLNDVSATASHRAAGNNTILNTTVNMRGSFILHHGLNPEDCELRITRSGERNLDLSRMSPELRRIISQDRIPPGWQEVARMDFTDGTIGGRRVLTLEDSFVRLDFDHVLSATSTALPLSEDWQYRFQLLHDGADTPLATWTVRIQLAIDEAEDIDDAELVVEATGVDDELSVPFKGE